MAIQLSKKQSDLEKRLKILHNQVYGKTQLSVNSAQFTAKNKESSSSNSDIVFLQKDLLKIATLSSLAIAVQFMLYYLLQHHLLNFKFF